MKLQGKIEDKAQDKIASVIVDTLFYALIVAVVLLISVLSGSYKVVLEACREHPAEITIWSLVFLALGLLFGSLVARIIGMRKEVKLYQQIKELSERPPLEAFEKAMRGWDESDQMIISATKQLEESNKVMNEANIKLPKVVEYIDELKASIKRLTEEKLEMLTDSERETIFTLFHAETMNIKDENIAHHLILLGCVDELPSGEYVLNGEWRKIISEIERKEAK